jgi:hypothetical protein
VVLCEIESGRLLWAVSVEANATGDRRSLARAGHKMGFPAEVIFLDDETVACGATRGNVLCFRVANGKLVRKACIHPEAPVVFLALDDKGRSLVGIGPGERRTHPATAVRPAGSHITRTPGGTSPIV